MLMETIERLGRGGGSIMHINTTTITLLAGRSITLEFLEILYACTSITAITYF